MWRLLKMVQYSFINYVLPLLSRLCKYWGDGEKKKYSIQHVNWFDSYRFNFMMSHRTWRIPQLCENILLEYGRVVEMILLGQRVIIISDMKLATKLMTNHGHSLKQRFGNKQGLETLNMNERGLIWNNDVHTWKANRVIFETALSNGSQKLEELSRVYFQNVEKHLEIAKPISILTIIRDYTISMTMKGLFGIRTDKAWREKAIRVVGNYFKAWEFFLLTPVQLYCAQDAALHNGACIEMLKLSEEIFEMATTNSNFASSNFITLLTETNEKAQVLQCITEMLLAGTDTSSLTMFYTILFLASHPESSNQIARLLQENNFDVAQKHITRLYYESMRLIPVGPVILRQAEADIFETQGRIFLRQGDGVIFNVAGMNRGGSSFLNPEEFKPSRYETEKFPLSFGIGKKSCVGRIFAEKEMKIFFSWLLPKYAVLGNSARMTELLETRWDIANTPAKDVQVSLFPRRVVYILGQGQGVLGRSSMLDAIREEYPNLQIHRWWTSGGQRTGNRCLEFAFVNISSAAAAGEAIHELSKKDMVIYFPHDDFAEDENMLRALERSGCKYVRLRPNTDPRHRLKEILQIIANLNMK